MFRSPKLRAAAAQAATSELARLLVEGAVISVIAGVVSHLGYGRPADWPLIGWSVLIGYGGVLAAAGMWHQVTDSGPIQGRRRRRRESSFTAFLGPGRNANRHRPSGWRGLLRRPTWCGAVIEHPIQCRSPYRPAEPDPPPRQRNPGDNLDHPAGTTMQAVSRQKRTGVNGRLVHFPDLV
jgi:hypothetical protein